MHVSQDLLWRRILKTFWILEWTKQGRSGRVSSVVAESFSLSALFSSKKWKNFDTVAFSFVCDKYYPIMD